MSLLKKLASQTAVYGLSTIVGRLLNYLLVPLYTRVFLPTEYGVVTEMYAYVGFFTVLFTYGMETAFFRFSEKISEKNKVYSTAFVSVLVTSAILCFILIAFTPAWSALLQYQNHPEYIIYFALILGLDALSAIPFASLRQQNKAFAFASIKLVNIAINIGINIFFLILCPKWAHQYEWADQIYNAEIGVGYVFIANLAASAITLLLLLPNIIKIKWQFDFTLWKQMIQYALPLLIVGFAGITDEMLGRALLKWLLPYSEAENLRLLGIYGANYKLAVLIALFTQAYRFAAEPLFFSQANNSNAPALYADMMRYFVLVQSALFLFIMLFIDYFKLFIGVNFQEGLHVVPVLLLANIALGIYYNLSIWYKLTDKTMLGAYVAIFGAIVTIILNIILIPLYGYFGSACATLSCYTLMVIVSWYLGQKYFPVNYQWHKLLGYLAIAIGIWLAKEYWF